MPSLPDSEIAFKARVLVARFGDQAEAQAEKEAAAAITRNDLRNHSEWLRILRVMAKRLPKALAMAFAAFLLFAPAYAADQPSLTLYPTEPQAQAHCPADIVVWLNLPSGIYHYRGQRFYANTRHGAFVCEKEAVGAGDRPSRNGQ